MPLHRGTMHFHRGTMVSAENLRFSPFLYFFFHFEGSRNTRKGGLNWVSMFKNFFFFFPNSKTLKECCLSNQF
jgi:hypothetical protein